MDLTLCDIRNECINALQDQFKGIAGVHVKNRDITKTKADAWAMITRQ
jgi:hypothetical protein